MRIFLFVIAISLVAAINSSAQTAKSITKTPDELCKEMINNPEFVANSNGERFCWQAKVGMDQFITNYKETKKTEWLDAGVKYYDFLLSKLIVDPDGYKGWIGLYDYNTNLIMI